MYTSLINVLCFFPFAHSLHWCMFFLLRRKKKMGIFGGGNGPWKNLYFQVVYTQTHKKRDCSDFERERRGGIHIPNSISLSPFKHITFAPDSPEKNSLYGGVFLLAFHFVSFVQLPTRLCVFFSFLKHLSPLRKFLFFDLHSCSSGWHFYYYTHIYIIIHI